jgi:hypothetical protein
VILQGNQSAIKNGTCVGALEILWYDSLVTFLPLFMSEIPNKLCLHFDLRQNGWLNGAIIAELPEYLAPVLDVPCLRAGFLVVRHLQPYLTTMISSYGRFS